MALLQLKENVSFFSSAEASADPLLCAWCAGSENETANPYAIRKIRKQLQICFHYCLLMMSEHLY